ncbi:hypothetical protein RIR_jg11593.t1 [Rhizophagus irregularis DAOM 181602=DAOM 197198]|uniref:Uncharacterized protein n=1 Tax=Rhizophagus irregularis (strain DAOM 181602 / DAOM 197198 / MUCL 43194) TaxID=747089 RepID=U9T166_RHIID|nr:hypothetical protein RIR_jg11593.t1 [Rhizophagus irregularis DAOM 181602=DAOM 197198]
MSRAQLIASRDSAWLGIPGSRIASWLESTARVEQLDLQMRNKNRRCGSAEHYEIRLSILFYAHKIITKKYSRLKVQVLKKGTYAKLIGLYNCALYFRDGIGVNAEPIPNLVFPELVSFNQF